MRITVLLENTTDRSDMLTEHGLSLYIETDSSKILFDMGQSDFFARNAAVLGVDLSSVDLAVLSHGHYDHGGGLAHFLAVNDRACVYLQREAFLPYYNGEGRYIGLDGVLAGTTRLRYVDESYQIADGVALFSCNQRPRKYTTGTFGLRLRQGTEDIPDPFRHEQYLLLQDGGRRVLISGCSHKGILDIVQWFSPDVLVGGFHLSKMPTDARLQAYASALSAYPTQYYTCHCTGEAQYHYMKEQMPNLHILRCGDTVLV